MTDAVNSQLRRTDDVKRVVEGMETNIENNRLVMEKLQNFLQKVEAHDALITATATIDDALSEAVGELKRHVQEQINSIQTHTTEATQDLDTLLRAERGNLDRLKKLDNLDSLTKSIESMKSAFQSQNAELSKQISNLANNVGSITKEAQITASIGLPPIVLWIVAGLISLASIFSVYSFFYPSDKSVQSATVEEVINENNTALSDTAMADTLQTVDSTKIK